MPLPDAPPPEKSRLYEELKSKTALPSATGAITPDLIDNLKNATFLDAENEDQLRRLLLLMQATGVGSTSGPIPGTQHNINKTVTNNNYTTIFTPGVGEVYQFVAGSAGSTTNPSGNVTTEVDIYDAADDVRVLFIDISSSSTSDYPLSETNFPPVYISHPYILRFKCEGTFDAASRNFSVIRVR